MPTPLPAEPPSYVLPQVKKRVMIPKIVSLLVLGLLFYLGVLLNLSLLQLTAEEESAVNLVTLIFLLLIIAVGIYLGYHQVTPPYRFYQNRIAIRKKEVFYSQIQTVRRKQNILDKLFKTYSLDLGNKNLLQNLSQEVQIENYLQQLINYSRGAA